METFEEKHTIQLLSRFSHCINILPFFGIRRQAKYIMQILGRKTNELWSECSSNFDMKLVDGSRLSLTIERAESLHELLINDRYKKYTLNIELQEEEGLSHLIKFFKSVNDIFDVEISRITGGGDFERSPIFTPLVNYLNNACPDIPIPLPDGFADKRFQKNKLSIFHYLTENAVKIN